MIHKWFCESWSNSNSVKTTGLDHIAVFADSNHHELLQITMNQLWITHKSLEISHESLTNHFSSDQPWQHAMSSKWVNQIFHDSQPVNTGRLTLCSYCLLRGDLFWELKLSTSLSPPCSDLLLKLELSISFLAFLLLLWPGLLIFGEDPSSASTLYFGFEGLYSHFCSSVYTWKLRIYYPLYFLYSSCHMTHQVFIDAILWLNFCRH